MAFQRRNRRLTHRLLRDMPQQINALIHLIYARTPAEIIYQEIVHISATLVQLPQEYTYLRIIKPGGDTIFVSQVKGHNGPLTIEDFNAADWGITGLARLLRQTQLVSDVRKPIDVYERYRYIMKNKQVQFEIVVPFPQQDAIDGVLVLDGMVADWIVATESEWTQIREWLEKLVMLASLATVMAPPFVDWTAKEISVDVLESLLGRVRELIAEFTSTSVTTLTAEIMMRRNDKLFTVAISSSQTATLPVILTQQSLAGRFFETQGFIAGSVETLGGPINTILSEDGARRKDREITHLPGTRSCLVIPLVDEKHGLFAILNIESDDLQQLSRPLYHFLVNKGLLSEIITALSQMNKQLSAGMLTDYVLRKIKDRIAVLDEDDDLQIILHQMQLTAMAITGSSYSSTLLLKESPSTLADAAEPTMDVVDEWIEPIIHVGRYPPKAAEWPLGRSITKRALKSGQTQKVNNVDEDPDYLRPREEGDERRKGSELIVPLPGKEKFIGVIDLGSDRINAYDQSMVIIIEEFARAVASALNNMYNHTFHQTAKIFPPAQGKLSVFLSHTGTDKKIALEIKSFLEQAGSDVIADLDRVGLSNFLQFMNDGIKKCHSFVVIQSPNAIISPNVETEIEMAHAAKKPICRFLVDGEIDDAPPLWCIYTCIDTRADKEAACQLLLDFLGLTTQ